MSEDDGFVRITLRLPRNLHQKLTEAAAGKKSMNAEIIERLELTFGPAPEISQELVDFITERLDAMDKRLERLAGDAEENSE